MTTTIEHKLKEITGNVKSLTHTQLNLEISEQAYHYDLERIYRVVSAPIDRQPI